MAARARRLNAVPADAPHQPAPDLRDAVNAAVGTMDWLSPTDMALRALALRQAEEIERSVGRADELAALMRDSAGDSSIYRRLEKLQADCDVTRTVGQLGPQLQSVLRDLGGTPSARAAMKKDKPVGGRLAALRLAAGQHDAEDLDADAG